MNMSALRVVESHLESCWRVTLRVVGESPGEFVSKLMKDMLSGHAE